jgi:hypothetical protein
MINGQKIFIQVISGTTHLAVTAGMDNLFCSLTP